jgi:hypothetical protein
MMDYGLSGRSGCVSRENEAGGARQFSFAAAWEDGIQIDETKSGKSEIVDELQRAITIIHQTSPMPPGTFDAHIAGSR